MIPTTPLLALVASLKAWALAAMIASQPVAPWRATYDATAEAMATVAADSPLFQGADAEKRTLSLFVSVAWFESRFDPKAKGDCSRKDDKGRCLSAPQSLCLFQIGVSNLETLGLTKDAILESTEVCTRAARRMMKTSFAVCRGKRPDDLLAHYAAGGETCERGYRESGHRIRKARWLFEHVVVRSATEEE